jgi:hypothetical protein
MMHGDTSMPKIHASSTNSRRPDVPLVISLNSHSPTEIIATFVHDALGNVVPLSGDYQHPTVLASGRYQLHWDMRANGGASGSVQLCEFTSSAWHPINPLLKLTMRAGATRMSSDDSPPPPVAPYFFTV